MNDDDWLEALRGKRPSDGGLDAQKAQALRRAIAADHAGADNDEPAGRGAAYDRLMFRLRREGLLKGGSSNHSWRSMAAAIAVVGVLGVMFASMQMEDRGDGETLRGGVAVTLSVPQPQEVANRVEAILKAQGVTVHRAALQDGGVELRAAIPPASLPAVRKDLEGLGVTVPDSGRLAVDIVKP